MVAERVLSRQQHVNRDGCGGRRFRAGERSEDLSDLKHVSVGKIDDKVKAVFWAIGAGNENRTRNWSLGSSRDTFSPYPRITNNITS